MSLFCFRRVNNFFLFLFLARIANENKHFIFYSKTHQNVKTQCCRCWIGLCFVEFVVIVLYVEKSGLFLNFNNTRTDNQEQYFLYI